MADPTADNPELAVDELRRKARRRLIGAVVLALAAVTLLPLLLEQDQKPLGDDVSVQIPPIDDSRFVTGLAGDKGKGAAPPAKPEGKSAPATDARGEAKAEPGPEGKAEPRAEAKSDAMPEAKTAEAAAESKTAPAPSPAATSASTASGGPPAAASAPAAVASAPPAPSAQPQGAASRGEGFIVQLGAFTDSYGANALANRLRKAGYPAYTEPIETSRGKLWRVRVGGYPSRAAANEARDKLKADGHNGLVSAAK